MHNQEEDNHDDVDYEERPGKLLDAYSLHGKFFLMPECDDFACVIPPVAFLCDCCLEEKATASKRAVSLEIPRFQTA